MTYSKLPIRAVGGRLALDFLNTADWSSDNEILHEKIQTIHDLDIWVDALGIKPIVTDLETCDLSAVWQTRLELRKLFLALLSRKQLDWKTIGFVNAQIQQYESPFLHQQVEQPFYPVVKNSFLSHILTSTLAILSEKREFERVRMCSGHDCGWLFIDESRNLQRRWCTMETCGNREKARRFYKNRKDRTKT